MMYLYAGSEFMDCNCCIIMIIHMLCFVLFCVCVVVFVGLFVCLIVGWFVCLSSFFSFLFLFGSSLNVYVI